MSGEQDKTGTAIVRVFSIQSTANPPAVMDISSMYSEMSYYESIDTPAVSMTITVVDSTNLKGMLPIVGGESIVYDFADSLPDSPSIKGVSRIFKMADRVRLKKGTDSYGLYCITNEMLRDQYDVVDEAYGPFTARDIVSKIIESYITPKFGKKLVSFDETDGMMMRTFTRVSPFTAIKYLSAEAKAEDPKSSSVFFFFENADGYHFRSLESMFNQPATKTFNYSEDQLSSTGVESIFELNRITSMKEESGFDLMTGVNRGEFGVLISAYDPIAKKFTRKKYSHQDDYNKTDHAGGGKDIMSSGMSSELGSSPSFEKYIFTNSSAANIDYVVEKFPELQQTALRRQEFLHMETSAMARINARTMKFAIKGDSSIRAGQTINIFYPSSGDNIVNSSVDRLISGKYLITALAHRCTSQGNYTTTIECTKDSYDAPIRMGEV